MSHKQFLNPPVPCQFTIIYDAVFWHQFLCNTPSNYFIKPQQQLRYSKFLCHTLFYAVINMSQQLLQKHIAYDLS